MSGFAKKNLGKDNFDYILNAHQPSLEEDMTSIVLVEDIKSYHISAISILTLQMAVDKDCRIVHAFCPYISSRDNAPT